MARYIDIDKYKKFRCSKFYTDCQLIKNDFSCIDCYYKLNDGKEDVAPVVHARWIDINPNNNLDPRMKCSNCGEIQIPMISWKGCPICLAKMDGDE